MVVLSNKRNPVASYLLAKHKQAAATTSKIYAPYHAVLEKSGMHPTGVLLLLYRYPTKISWGCALFPRLAQVCTASGADELEPATPIPSLCHGIFIDWSIFSTPFLLWKKASSGPVTQWRQLVSCDWLWHSHGSLIQSRFDLKINRSMKTPWQKYSEVACSSS